MSNNIENLPQRIEKIETLLRKLSPRNRRPSPIYRARYQRLEAELERLRQLELTIDSSAEETTPSSIEDTESQEDFHSRIQQSDNYGLQEQTIHYTNTDVSFLGRLALVDDLSILLNDEEISLAILDRLQNLYPGLSVFAKRFLLINRPLPRHFEILKSAVEVTKPAYIDTCSDSELLRSLLSIYQYFEEVKMVDGTELIDTFVATELENARKVLKEQLHQTFLHTVVVQALIRLRGDNQLSLSILLDIANNINQMEWSHRKQLTNLVLKNTIIDLQVVIAPLHTYLKKTRLEIQQPLLATLGRILSFSDIEKCVDLATHNTDFALWFIYKELVFLPNEADEQFIDYLRKIVISLKQQGQSRNVSTVLQDTMNYDWQDKHFRSFVKRLISQGDVLAERLHGVLNRRDQAKLLTGTT